MIPKKTLPLALIAIISAEFISAETPPFEGAITPFLEKGSQLDIQPIFSSERFPNVVVTRKGTVLATFGSKHIRARRSEDGGKSWSEEITIANPGFHGGGTIVDESSGDILVFVEEAHPPALLTVFRSRDDGKTWLADLDVQIEPEKGKSAPPSMHMNEHGITLRHGKHKGRLIRPSRDYGQGNRPKELFPTHYTNAIYSDDGGKSWRTSAPFSEFGTGEAMIAELSDGRIYYNSRRHWAPAEKNPLRRWTAISEDGGATWSQARICETLPDGPQDTDYGCMAGLVRLPVLGNDILIYSNCDSKKGRNRGTVWASFDGGESWPIKRLITEGAFAYSSLSAGRPQTPSQGWIYLHFESNGSKMARFNLAWIMRGKPTGDGKVPASFY